jgi:mono/diheme cytochrome c family protein
VGINANRKVAACSLLAVFLSCGGQAWSQNKPATPKQNEPLIYSVKGPALYKDYCAACHGLQGKGDGPAALALKNRPADLTVLAKNNRGKFPAARAQKIIAGDEPSLQIHGSREMPVWGPIFHRIEEDQDFGNVRIKNLSDYLQSIQQK